MDPRLLEYFDRELRYMREMGGEFAREFPKIAGRLGLDAFECADPYVERLLEGFAFLAARVQLKVDAEFPRFTQHLLEMVFPHYLAPTPSMAVVQVLPKGNEGSLAEGFSIPRGSQLRSGMVDNEQTACEYRTAHDLVLWPLEIPEAEYLPSPAEVAGLGIPKKQAVKAGLRLRLRCTGGLQIGNLPIERLPLFLRGAGTAVKLYEQLLANLLEIVVLPTSRPFTWLAQPLPKTTVRRLGFDDDQPLLPYTSRSFQGYRLLQEYFAFPERFLFVELTELQRALGACREEALDLVFLFDRSDPELVDLVDGSLFNLFCTPAINLFPKRCDRIHLSNRTAEHHIVADRTRAMDFEVHSVTRALGFGDRADPEVEFLPFYKVLDRRVREGEAFYTLYRDARRLSAKQLQGHRSTYTGSEVFISLVDSREAPWPGSLKQLGLEALCTNRHLPMRMPVGVHSTDFTLQTGGPYDSIRCLAGPTPPKPSNALKEVAWRLISHLTLNYLSLADSDADRGAAAFREILSLYGDSSEPAVRKQVEGVLSISSKPVVRRIDVPKGVNAPIPVTFGRGLELSVLLDESAFRGSGPFLLGAVLEQFFRKYVSINSFTETIIATPERGEIMRWPVRMGNRHSI
ncbi:MAG: type VI secretion system baseplate subunit TssF [Syntrophobacteraceae bacterium]|nr:type VI secretion system baseplate subunit TssF [Syntrophobacteraceae bacterium]